MKQILYLCLLLSSINLFAQAHPILDELALFDVEGKVHIRATIKAGSSCLGMNILRAEDSLTFISIGQIAGICGSDAEPMKYSFIDENPLKNKTSFYKLQLGGFGETEVLSIRVIDVGQSGVVVIPNPVRDQTTIYFKNPLHEQHNLFIINSLGATILIEKTQEQVFQLDLKKLDAGVYFFVISDESSKKKAAGRIIKI